MPNDNPTTAEMIAACDAALQDGPQGPFYAEFTYAWFVCYDKDGVMCQCVDESDARLIAALLNAAPAILAAARFALGAADCYSPEDVRGETIRDTAAALLTPLYDALCATGAVEAEHG